MQQDRELAQSLRQLCGVLEQVADKLDGNEHTETGDAAEDNHAQHTAVGPKQWERELLEQVVRYAKYMGMHIEREDWGQVAGCVYNKMREDLAEIDINDPRWRIKDDLTDY